MTPGSETRRLPGDEGVWFFLCADAMFFLLLFGSHSYYRLLDPSGFAAAQAHLHPAMAALNTGVLLTSSWCVARAVAYLRSGDEKRLTGALRWAIVLGLAFVVIKVVEYAILLRGGVNLGSNPFTMYYFIITGIHLLHVVAGLIALAVCAARTAAASRAPAYERVLESAGAFWHIVDILWLFIFPLLYLLGQVAI